MKSVILILLVAYSIANEEVQPEEGTVKVITLDNYESVVANSDKDVLLDFYAPWNNLSQRLEPVYNELASAVQVNPNLVIAKVDATQHKLPGQTIKGYPTIKFFKKGATPEVLDYRGARTLEGFVKFLKENTSHPWVPLAEESSEQTQGNGDL